MIQYNRELITPEIAKTILSKNRNRDLKSVESNIVKLTQLMLTNNFVNDLSIIFIDTEGYLIDGQSRLTAVVRSNKPYYFMVARNTPPEYQLLIDTNRKSRSAADTLQLHTDTGSYTLISGIIAKLIKLENSLTPNGSDANRDIRYTNANILDYYLKHSLELEESAKIGIKIYHKCGKILPPSLICSYLIYFNRNKQESGTYLMEEILIHSDKKFCDAIKNKLMAGIRDSRKKLTYAELNQYVFKAYNAILNKKEYNSFRYDPNWIAEIKKF